MLSIANLSFPQATAFASDRVPYGGGRIAFLSPAKPGSPNTRVFILNPDGTGLRQLTTDQGCKVPLCGDLLPIWSPNGRYIAFIRGGVEPGKSSLGIVEVESGLQTFVASNAFPLERPVWSPDSTTVTYTSAPRDEADGFSKIYSVRLGTLTPQLTYRLEGKHVSHPAWSPDGTQLLVSISGDGKTSWVSINKDGTNSQEWATGQSQMLWAPDGKTLTIAQNDVVSLVDAHASTSPKLTIPFPALGLLAGWSPDGKWLVVLSEPDNKSQNKVYIANTQTGDVRQITSQPAQYRSASWSPDSQHLVVQANVQTSIYAGLYILDLDSGALTALTKEAAFFNPTWSAAK